MAEIINKVANSALITFNLENYYDNTEVVEYDIKENLFQGLMLRERDLRMFVKEHDWERYVGVHVCIFCSVDAIVPTWAYMLLTSHLEPYAKSVYVGTAKELKSKLILNALSKVDWLEYQDKMVVIKGCGDLPVPETAYVEATLQLRKVAKSIMYGEPCSTVPIFKKKKS